MPTQTVAFANGTDSILARGQKEIFTFTNSWTAGDWWSVLMETTAGSVQVGYVVDDLGSPILAGTTPTFGLTLNGRVYLANGRRFNFCDSNDPTQWLGQGAGAGYVSLLIHYGEQDSIVALAPYQGYLAALLRNSIQIWVTNADPAQFQVKQVLGNIGTNYAFSVQPLGNLDVLFLADSGVRSLRVRDDSLNAETVDVGSPIDLIVRSVLAAGLAFTPISIVEPTSNRYWLFLHEKIYVLSLFPDSGIRAWSTYSPYARTEWTGPSPSAGVFPPSGEITYTLTPGVYYRWYSNPAKLFVSGSHTFNNNDTTNFFFADSTLATVTGTPGDPLGGTLYQYGQTSFVPFRFVVKDGTVCCRGGMVVESGYKEYLLAYGGGYDNTIATVQSPYLSLASPSMNKFAHGIDFALSGEWAIAISHDQASGVYESVGTATGPSYDGGEISIGQAGTHASFSLVSPQTTNAKCVLSSFTLIYQSGAIE